MDYEALAKAIAESHSESSLSDPLKGLAERYKNLAKLETPSYTAAIVGASKLAGSIQETLKLSFENLGLSALAENSALSSAAVRLAAPLEELQQTGFFKLFSAEPQIQALSEVIGSFESRFRLPKFAEVARLVEPVQTSIFAKLAEYTVPIPDLKIAVASMKTPWLDVVKEERSLTAFAELQGIGEAVRSLPPFPTRSLRGCCGPVWGISGSRCITSKDSKPG